MSRNGETFEQNLVATSYVVTRPDFPITVQNKHETSTFDHSSGLPCEQGAGGGVYSCLDVASPCCRLHLWAFSFFFFTISAVCSLIQGQPTCQRSHDQLGGCLCRRTNSIDLHDEESRLQMVCVSPLCLCPLMYIFSFSWNIYLHTHTHTHTQTNTKRWSSGNRSWLFALRLVIVRNTVSIYNVCALVCTLRSRGGMGRGWVTQQGDSFVIGGSASRAHTRSHTHAHIS